MHTFGESEHFCTDMLRKFICSFESYIPNLGMFFNSISNFVDQLLEYTTNDWPWGGLETAVDFIY